MERTIAVIGLGYVGLPVAVAFAKKKFETIGFDLSRTRIKELEDGFDNTNEVDIGFSKIKNLSFTANSDILSNANFFVIAVPTPITNEKEPDLSALILASEIVGKYLKPSDIVVFESTVFPGCTEDICIPVLEKESNLKCPESFGVGYSPERINPGDPHHRIQNITKIVSGITPSVANEIKETYEKIIEAGIYLAPSIKIAEAAKIIENTQRDLNIALMNELSAIFRKMSIDTYDVLEAAKTKWNFIPFEPGLVGGHCIGVDPYYLTFKAKELGISPDVILAGRNTNESFHSTIISECSRYSQEQCIKLLNIAVLGITFKENVPDIRNSQAISMTNKLLEYGYSVTVCDPLINAEEAKSELNSNAKIFNDLDEFISSPQTSFDVVILAAPHDEFTKLGWDFFSQFQQKQNYLLIDIKGKLDRDRCPNSTRLWRP